MFTNSSEVSKREAAAWAHIEAVYGTPDDEFGATLFVSLHLGELDASYWMKHTGNDKPNARQVLRTLERRIDPEEREIDEEEKMESLDFTLPEGVSNYVICVQFDGSGNICGVSMES